jgi:hypothetical protein
MTEGRVVMVSVMLIMLAACGGSNEVALTAH